ncbi:TIGR04255 family protein [Rhizobium leguminosarum]|uniref:TIGR04255 family protein n=1 Tax=Rhizobium ruizarguesonis TaxID=2081791 RepID=A0AAE5C277_9HYPH|nr:TIGR04255 family protein [Rhizobium ruizarguesonis]NEI48627.1 TIGR04255 family protein [Rhizobium ruizarguesonis]
MTNYSKPPIIEAIIEFVPAEGFSDREMQRLAKKLESKYDRLEDLADYDVQIRVHGNSATPGIAARREWYRLFSADGADAAIVNRKSFVASRLAPYKGWSSLLGNFERNLNLFEKTIGFRKWERIGVRYINRIDVPSQTDERINIKEYLNIYPAVPPLLDRNWTAEATRLEIKDTDTGLLIVVNCLRIDPVLLNHQSFILDIDIVVNHDIPLKRELLMEKLAAIQKLKNEVFENLITEKTRTFFNA